MTAKKSSTRDSKKKAKTAKLVETPTSVVEEQDKVVIVGPKRAVKPSRSTKIKPRFIEVFAKSILACELDHEQYCNAIGKCGCITRRFKRNAVNKVDGKVHIQIVEQTFPPTVTFLSGRNTIEMAALQCDSVARAVARKDIRVIAR